MVSSVDRRRYLRVIWRALLLPSLIAVQISGCTSVPLEMHMAGATELIGEKVWPGLPQLPRYRYAGELIGEDNFQPANGNRRGGVTRVLRWLVGLGARRDDPVVLQRPQSGAVDGQGRIFVSDTSRGGIFVFDPVAGKLEVWEFAEWYKPFIAPIGVAVTRSGELLVADAERAAVFRLDSEGKPAGKIADESLIRPTGIALDPATGLIYVADTRSHDVKVFTPEGTLVNVIGAPGNKPGTFNAPVHISFAGGQLYVVDTLNARVQVFSADGTYLSTVGERGLYLGNLTHPKGVVADSDGNVYVTESFYDYLLIYDREGKFLLPIGGTGSGVGQFFLPAGIWMDQQERLYVADMFNGRVMVLDYLGG